MTLFKNHVTGKTLLNLFNNKKYDALCKKILDMLGDYERECYTRISAEDQTVIDDTAAAILYIFSRTDFLVPKDYVPLLIASGHLMSNLVALSAYKTTDSYLQHVMNQKGNLTKILAFYSCRNKPLFNADIFFDLSPQLATLWWLAYSTPSCGCPTKLIETNVNRHLSKVPEKFELRSPTTVPVYFDCTYTAVQKDREIKTALNTSLRKILPSFKQAAQVLDEKAVTVVTGRWFPTSAVYKASAPYLEALSKKYKLTLVHLGEKTDQLNTKIFDRVIYTGDVGKKPIDLDIFRSLNAVTTYFPDVGMSNESVILSNLRLSPIMVTAYGHPSSTWGSEIDYFIGGQETELPELAADNYSERLVLIPGIGQVSVFPNYAKRNPDKSKEQRTINCAWTSPKLNYTMLKCLREIIDAVPGTMIRIFPAWTIGRHNSMISCVSDLSELFGDEELAVCPELPYQDYLIEMEKSSLTLDSWPFGGYNTIIDSLFVGVPVITLEGTRFYNRASSALMRRVGLNDLVAKTKQQYVEKAIRYLVCSSDNKDACATIANETRLRSLLCENGEAEYFVKAFDYLISNHSRLKVETNREPIIIC